MTVGEVTTGGVGSAFNDSGPGTAFREIAQGPDGAMWFTNYSDNSIWRLSPW